MLAEIFLIRMEAILRASKESAPADDSRFVPIRLADKEFKDCLIKQLRAEKEPGNEQKRLPLDLEI